VVSALVIYPCKAHSHFVVSGGLGAGATARHAREGERPHAERGSVMSAPGAFAGSHALRACWHLCAFRRDRTGRPVHAALLGESLVLWRAWDGRPGANSECAHRGAALFLGWAGGAGVDCRYHGWRSRPGGRWWPFHRPGWGDERGLGYFASQPVAADPCRGYVITRRNYNLDQSRNSTRRAVAYRKACVRLGLPGATQPDSA
jgi:Rieske [2Fe-2S] domain